MRALGVKLSVLTGSRVVRYSEDIVTVVVIREILDPWIPLGKRLNPLSFLFSRTFLGRCESETVQALNTTSCPRYLRFEIFESYPVRIPEIRN